MDTGKRFDCVQMKDRCQAALRKRYPGLSDTERETAIARDFAVSASPVAKLWRHLLAERDAPRPSMAVAEDVPHYPKRGSRPERPA